jgi:hypothetical protein
MPKQEAEMDSGMPGVMRRLGSTDYDGEGDSHSECDPYEYGSMYS